MESLSWEESDLRLQPQGTGDVRTQDLVPESHSVCQGRVTQHPPARAGDSGGKRKYTCQNTEEGAIRNCLPKDTQGESAQLKPCESRGGQISGILSTLVKSVFNHGKSEVWLY